jgi:hypothetical protein
MQLAGKSKAGNQRWRCRKGEVTCSYVTLTADGRVCTNVHKGGRPSRGDTLPTDEALRIDLQTLTYRQIATKYGSTRDAVCKRIARSGLVGASPHGAKKRPVKPKKPVEPPPGPVDVGWLGKPMGKPHGGAGWFNVAGIYTLGVMYE